MTIFKKRVITLLLVNVLVAAAGSVVVPPRLAAHHLEDYCCKCATGGLKFCCTNCYCGVGAQLCHGSFECASWECGVA